MAPVRPLSTSASTSAVAASSVAPALGRPERAGPWGLGNWIASGGTTEVYLGKREGSQARAAVKVATTALEPEVALDPKLLTELRNNPELAATLPPDLQREGDALRRLRASPNVVDAFEDGLTPDLRPFLAMELLEGKDLFTQINRGGRLKTDALVKLVQDVSAGLEAARVAGITHLDVKPGNAVWDDPRQLWKLIDFGNAKVGASEVHLQTPGLVVGTASYMSPEHLTADVVDHRADVFALAATAYEGATGRRAFQTHALDAHLGPRRPSSIAGGMPEEIDSVLAVGLALDPAQRFSTAGEMSEALTAAAQGHLPAELKRRADDVLASTPWK